VFLRDFLLGLTLFFTISAASAAEHGASLSAILDVAAEARNFGGQHALLAVVFSMMVALNLWFFRHLRRVYASPRHGG
jgi:hypothetical protein